MPKSFSNDDLALDGSAVLGACDLADGVADGAVSNPRACRFDPKILLCRGDKAGTCLSGAQVTALQRAAPGGDAARFARLFLIPGMNHCDGGPATDLFDQLAPLVRWVEAHIAPDAIIATANPASPWPGRTRPLCAYPKQARYVGSGDVNDARNLVRK